MDVDRTEKLDGLDEALVDLARPGVRADAGAGSVPSRPGLYAIRGPASAWEALGLGVPPDGRPLYVGKAEDSLVARDVKTHFGTGRTGSSTVRRSVGALLAGPLDLRAIPRNLANPGSFSQFAFQSVGEERLSAWMLANLTLATWAPASPVDLGAMETLVLERLVPPLNLSKVRTPWKPQVSAARKVMAAQARAWTGPA